MGSGASKKKPESTVQKKLSVISAFSSAGKRAQEKREHENTDANGNGTRRGTLILEPDIDEENEAPVANDNEKVDSTLQNGVTAEDPDVDDEVFDKITKIQSVFRGFQDRKALQKQNEMAIKIQRQFRRHRSSILSESDVSEALKPEEQPVIAPVPDYEKPAPVKKLTKEDQMRIRRESMKEFHRVLAERKDQRRQRARAWRDKGGPDADHKEFKVEIGEKTKQEFGNFQDEITELKWYAEQQMEITLCGGKDYVPPRILLISSKVPKAEVLQETIKEGVLVFRYDFNNDTFESILDAIRINLQAHKPGCMAQSVCFYAQGGPGYVYMMKKKVLTTAKLKKAQEADQVRFWKELGKMMSRIHPEDTVIHMMGSNLLGSESGLQLFDDLEDLMRPNIVRFESPLELSQEGAQMINTYFNPTKYHLWKSTKYSKSDFKLPPTMK